MNDASGISEGMRKVREADNFIGMTTVTVRQRKPSRWAQNKPVRGVLHGRTTRQWRGRKFIVWVPWKVEPLQKLVAYHGLDLEAELFKIVADEMSEMVKTNWPDTDELWNELYRIAGEPSNTLEFLRMGMLDNQNE